MLTARELTAFNWYFYNEFHSQGPDNGWVSILAPCRHNKDLIIFILSLATKCSTPGSYISNMIFDILIRSLLLLLRLDELYKARHICFLIDDEDQSLQLQWNLLDNLFESKFVTAMSCQRQVIKVPLYSKVVICSTYVLLSKASHQSL